MNWLVHLLAPHTAMGNDFARFLAATLITAVVYMAAVIGWRIRERYVVRRFFRTAERFGFTRHPDLPEPSARIAGKQAAASVS